MAAKMVNKRPGPAASKQELEKIVTIAATIYRTKLLMAMALADRPGLESTRYTEVGVVAFI